MPLLQGRLLSGVTSQGGWKLGLRGGEGTRGPGQGERVALAGAVPLTHGGSLSPGSGGLPSGAGSCWHRGRSGGLSN